MQGGGQVSSLDQPADPLTRFADPALAPSQRKNGVSHLHGPWQLLKRMFPRPGTRPPQRPAAPAPPETAATPGPAPTILPQTVAPRPGRPAASCPASTDSDRASGRDSRTPAHRPRASGPKLFRGFCRQGLAGRIAGHNPPGLHGARRRRPAPARAQTAAGRQAHPARSSTRRNRCTPT